MGKIKLTKVGENTVVKGKLDKPFDEHTWHILNSLLGNDIESPILELGDPLPEFLFECDTIICFGGAEVTAHCNENTLKSNYYYLISGGDRLKFDEIKRGKIVYLAIKGGFSPDLEGKKITEKIEFDIPDLTINSAIKSHGVGRGISVDLEENLDVRIKLEAKNKLTEISKMVLENDHYHVNLNSERDSLFFLGSILEIDSKKPKLVDCVKGDLYIDENGQLFFALIPLKQKIKIGEVYKFDIPKIVQMDERYPVKFKEVPFESLNTEQKDLEKKINIFQAAVKFELNK